MWTGFSDNFTCQNQKLDYAFFLIESDMDTSIQYLEKVKKYNPYGPSCTCCGDDYTISTSPTKHGALRIPEQEFLALCSENKVLIVSNDQIKTTL
ncbi:hypothetical protein CN918_28120 [Priestia megaterium]|nr:hypothetical protein CN918_28120 [Priestia megaterium]